MAHRFVLRGHMTLMLVAVILSGIVTSKLLLLLGLGSMQTRYVVAVISAYLVFVALVGLWLMYIRRVMSPTARPPSERGSSSSSIGGFGFDFGSGSGSGSSWGFDLDLDDGVWILIAFVAFISIVAVSAGWVIYDAPHMFGDAAFQFFLASGLLRGTKTLKAGGWTGVVVRRTVIPFVIVAIAAVVFGHIAQKLCPDARSVVEAFRLCVSKG